jgi:hypothetical protein
MNNSKLVLTGVLINICSIMLVAQFFTADSRAEEISLIPPDPILSLPKLPSDRISVHEPAGDWELTFHHNPLITKWNGDFFVAWHASSKSERTRPVYGRISKSTDNGTTWSVPAAFAQTGDGAYESYMRNRFGIAAGTDLTVNTMPWCFHVHDGKLYLMSKAWVEVGSTKYWRGRLHYTENGTDWFEIDGQTLDGYSNLNIRVHWSNHEFVTLSSGKLIAASYESSYRAPTTTDLSGLSGWTGGNISISESLADPGVWQGADGTIHYVGGRFKKYRHAYSSDNGASWNTMTEQSEFPYNGGESFGSLPDGRIRYLGTPISYSQQSPLVLAISEDGWNFTDMYIIRDEIFEQKYPWPYKGFRPGFEYPHGIADGQTLYVVYSVCRDRIELSRVDISSLIN